MLIVAILLTLLSITLLTVARTPNARPKGVPTLVVALATASWAYWILSTVPFGVIGSQAVGCICGLFALTYMLSAIGYLFRREWW